MPARWTTFVLRHRRMVVAAWVVVAGLGLWSAVGLHDRLETSFAVPGTESARADAILQQHFGIRPDGTFTVVFPVAHPSDHTVQARLQRRLARAAASIPTGRATKLQKGTRVLFGDIETTLDLQHAKRHTPALRQALRGGGPGRARHGRAGDPARPRPAARLRPPARRGARPADRAARPADRLRALHRGRRSRSRSQRARSRRRSASSTWSLPPTPGGRVRAEPGRADRARAGDRLLAARRLAVPRGARPRDGRRTRRSSRRWRPPAAPSSSPGLAVAIGLGLLLLMPIPFIRGLGLGGLPRPARGDRRRRDAPAGAPLAARAGGSGSSRRGRRRRSLGAHRRGDHAATRCVYLVIGGTAILVRRGRPRALSSPHPRLDLARYPPPRRRCAGTRCCATAPGRGSSRRRRSSSTRARPERRGRRPVRGGDRAARRPPRRRPARPT